MSEMRALVSKLVAHGVSERTSGEIAGVNRPTYWYRGGSVKRPGEPRRRILGLASKHKRYGHSRTTAVLRREGERVNHERCGVSGGDRG